MFSRCSRWRISCCPACTQLVNLKEARSSPVLGGRYCEIMKLIPAARRSACAAIDARLRRDRSALRQHERMFEPLERRCYMSTVYFVSATGSGSGNGTAGAPLNISVLANLPVKAGDVINVVNGSKPISSPLVFGAQYANVT